MRNSAENKPQPPFNIKLATAGVMNDQSECTAFFWAQTIYFREQQNESRYRGLDTSPTFLYQAFDSPTTFHVVIAFRTKTPLTPPHFGRSVLRPLWSVNFF